MLARQRRSMAVAVVGTFVGSLLVVGAASVAPAVAGPVRPQIAGQPVSEPLEIESQGGVLRARLVARERRITLNGRRVLGTFYNGGYVGPTLVVSPGDTIRLTLVNRLDEMTNLHYHGMFVSPRRRSDNIFRMVDPGETAHYIVDIPTDHDPGLYWYHPHMHGLVEPQIFGGMSGLIVVRGLNERLPAGLQGVTRRVLALKDYQVHGGAIPQVNIDSGAPTIRTVNGQIRPTLTIAPGETQLWRIGNIGADIWYDVKVPGHRLVVVGHDGAPVWDVYSARHLVMPPGQRYEVLVTGTSRGATPVITRAFNQGPAGDQYPKRKLATLITKGPSQPTVAPPTSMAPDRSLRGEHVDRVRHFVFSEEPVQNQFFINGKQFDPHVNDVLPRKRTIEKWVIRNVTGELHPFHIHVNNFQVVKVNVERVALHGPQDVIMLPMGGKVTMLTEFKRFTGRYVFHCHIVAHEDNGMMATVKVVG
jgi:suppressor of ftsI